MHLGLFDYKWLLIIKQYFKDYSGQITFIKITVLIYCNNSEVSLENFKIMFLMFLKISFHLNLLFIIANWQYMQIGNLFLTLFDYHFRCDLKILLSFYLNIVLEIAKMYAILKVLSKILATNAVLFMKQFS